MVAIMPKDEEKKFRKFLENNIFKQSLVYFHQFRGGMCSYSFFAKTDNDHWVIKILLNKYITSDAHRYLETHIQECLPLKGIKMDNMFVYDGRTVTIQHYYGKVVPEKTINQKIITDILKNYQTVANLLFNFPIKNDKFNIKRHFEQYQQLEDEIQHSHSFKAKIMGYFLHKISPETLIYNLKKSKYIHGDFHNNQILLQDGKVSAFIDWDNMRIGYITEDYWRFFFYNLQYIYNPIVLYYCANRLFKQLLALSNVSKEEWQLAINEFLLHKIDGNLHKKFGIRRFVRFLYCYFFVKLATKHLQSLQNTGC